MNPIPSLFWSIAISVLIVFKLNFLNELMSDSKFMGDNFVIIRVEGL